MVAIIYHRLRGRLDLLTNNQFINQILVTSYDPESNDIYHTSMSLKKDDAGRFAIGVSSCLLDDEKQTNFILISFID